MDIAAKAAAMAASMAAKQPVEVKPTTVKMKGQEIPMAIHTPEAVIMVYGTDLMDKRSIDILSMCFNESIWTTGEDHGVRMLRYLGDGRPVNATGKPIYANCSIELGGITINLQHSFDKAIEMCLKNTETSVWAMFNQILIQSYLHEACHISARQDADNRAKMDAGDVKAEEDDCEKWSFSTLCKMAKTMNIEPNNYMDNVFFSMAWALFLETVKDDKDAWIGKQKHMLNNNIMFKLDPVEGKHIGLELTTFKTFIQLSSDDQDSDEWNMPTINAPSLANAINKAADTITQPPAQPYQSMTAEFANAEYAEYNDMDFANAQVPAGGFANEDSYAQVNPAMQQQFPIANNPQGGFAATPGNGFNREAAVYQPAATAIVYPQTGLSPEQTGAIVKGVYDKMYNRFFGDCGRLIESDAGFAYPEAVVTMPLTLTPEECAVVVKCECMNMQGQYQKNVPTSDGTLRGHVSSKAKIPMYKIFINNNGHEDVRIIMPQNVAKSNAGQLSKPAVEARAGACIMYVLEGDDDKVNAGAKKWVIKKVNGEWMAC